MTAGKQMGQYDAGEAPKSGDTIPEPAIFSSQTSPSWDGTNMWGEGSAKVMRPPLVRTKTYWGVCTALATHLEMPLPSVRIIFIVTAPLGISPLLYLWLLFFLPREVPGAGTQHTRLARTLAQRVENSRDMQQGSLLGWALLALGCAVIAAVFSFTAADVPIWVGGIVLLAIGIALIWGSGWSERQNEGSLWFKLLRIIGGVILVALAILWLTLSTVSIYTLIAGALAALAVLVGVGLALAPLWLRLLHYLNATQIAKARESERADIAAHLHDSVLQTLSLIRRKADDPKEVARLARTQERQLRAYLYTDHLREGASLAQKIKGITAALEDQYNVEISTVIVGDRKLGKVGESLGGIIREALTNALKHGQAPISLYVELGTDPVTAFIRDRGPGFNLDQISEDRHGVRDSIIGRAGRAGGKVKIKRLDPGTEIQIKIPFQEDL